MPQSSPAPSNLVLVALDDNNTGMHPIVGVVTRQPYGYRAHGEQFYILEQDNVPAMRVTPVAQQTQSATGAAEVAEQATEEPAASPEPEAAPKRKRAR